MCSHYQAIKERERFLRQFGVYPPDPDGRYDMWPGYTGVMIHRPPEADAGDEALPARQALAAQFGLLPHWARDTKFSRHTYNARSETAHNKPSFRDAWRKSQHCIVPADAIFEPDWRSGKAVPTRISRADGEPMGIAGLWSFWRRPGGAAMHSFTLLTVNADDHPLMRTLHKPEDEKRMVVILPQGSYDDWLDATPARAMDLMLQYPAQRLVATTDGAEVVIARSPNRLL